MGELQNYSIPIFSEIELANSKSFDRLPFKCVRCFNFFTVKVKYIRTKINIKKYGIVNRYCTTQCAARARNKDSFLPCANCKIITRVKMCKLNLSKSGKNYCSKRCAAVQNNITKIRGQNRSKFEIWFEHELTSAFPSLEILFNQRKFIGLELDVYIPSLNLAVEINGILHYKPIYGMDTLQSIQKNDKRKIILCEQKNIDLIIIDTSNDKNFSIKKSLKYIDFVKDRINLALT